jgi:hypothetical protein
MMGEQESSTVKHALAELGEKARKLQQFSYDFPDQGDGYFLFLYSAQGSVQL